MTAIVAWAITAIIVILFSSFLLYLLTLWRLPTSRRPLTPSYNRYGKQLGLTENPDYHENPGEDGTAGPDLTPEPGHR